MKKALIQLKFDEEKLTALGKYMQKKGVILEAELQDTIQKLYEKYVPPSVRNILKAVNHAEGRRQEPYGIRKKGGRYPGYR